MVTITGRTRQAKIVERRCTAGRTRDNRLKFKEGNRQILGRATVGTAVREALADPPLEFNGKVDLHAAAVLSCFRVYLALVLRIVS